MVKVGVFSRTSWELKTMVGIGSRRGRRPHVGLCLVSLPTE